MAATDDDVLSTTSEAAFQWEARLAAVERQRDDLLAIAERLVEIGNLANKEHDIYEPNTHLFAMVERLQELDDRAVAAIAAAKGGK